MFPAFASQLEEGLRTTDAGREAKKLSKSEGTVSLPDINQKPNSTHHKGPSANASRTSGGVYPAGQVMPAK